jgi:radical SAM protein with 4Fe4S-binding SPASM domain
MMKIIIKLVQKLKIARIIEDLYCKIPYYFGKGRAFHPLSAVLLVSYRCNLRCTMCFYYNEAESEHTMQLLREKHGEELSKSQIFQLIDDLADMRVKVLTIHGGEPLLYPDIFEITHYADTKRLLVNFVTNGTLINEQTARKISETHINHITFSLDGPEHIHDEVRNVSGTFHKLISGIKHLKELERTGTRIPSLSIATYISAVNQNHIHEIIDIIHELGISGWDVGLITYNSEKLSDASRTILGIFDDSHEGSLDNIKEEIKTIGESVLKKQRESVKDKNRNYCLDITFPSEKAIESYYDNSYNELNYCLYPWARTVISPYGDVLPCITMSMIGYSAGNIKETSLKQIWNGKQFVEFRKLLKKQGLLPICSKCCTINNIRKI